MERTEKKLEIELSLKLVISKVCPQIFHNDLELKELEHWIEKLQNKIEHLHRLTKNFIREGMSVILKSNYLFINDIFFFEQMKGTAMGIHGACIYEPYI